MRRYDTPISRPASMWRRRSAEASWTHFKALDDVVSDSEAGVGDVTDDEEEEEQQ